jgi:hypothetical protein
MVGMLGCKCTLDFLLMGQLRIFPQSMVNQIIELDENKRRAYDQNCRNQSKVKKDFDKSARQRDFIVGDTILLWDKGR